MDNFSPELRKLNLKITPKRLAILEILRKDSVFLSPEEIWKKLRRRFKRVGLPTVYRNLQELSEGNIISKVTHPNRQLYYYLCQNKSQHHHFICFSCHKVEDINFCRIMELEKEVKMKLKGKILSHILQINGLCKDCLNKKEI